MSSRYLAEFIVYAIVVYSPPYKIFMYPVSP